MFEWSGLHQLVWLKGLKKLVVGKKEKETFDAWTKVQREEFVEGLKGFFNGLEVEVVFEE